MPVPLRAAIPAALIAAFLALATVALDRPGYDYDEVLFVPVALRTLGQCDVDASVSHHWGCFPLMVALSYVGAAKAWVHAPLFALVGIDAWTVRLPSILMAAAALAVLWRFARLELGWTWAAVLLALLATDPVLIGHVRIDYGPQVIAMLTRVIALAALWRWLRTGRTAPLALACAAMLVGFFDKLSFVWVIGALAGAAVLVDGRRVRARLRDGAPAQRRIAAVTAALLAWGALTLVRKAMLLPGPDAALAHGVAEQLVKVWNLYAATFRGTRMLEWVFGAPAPATTAFNWLALAQLVAAALALALRRPWTRRAHLLAYLTATFVLLVVAIAATRQVGGTHHLFMVWPLPTLHLVALLAVLAEAAAVTGARRPRTAAASLATVACGALLAWNVHWQVRYVDAWRNAGEYGPRFDPAIARLAARVDALGVDRVISVDWGLHQQLVTLADRSRSAMFREWSWRLGDAAKLDRAEFRRAVAEHLSGRRVAFVLHSPRFTVFPGARARLEALLERDPPCVRHEEAIAGSAGEPLYEVVIANYRSCGDAESARRGG
jgi:hypothetical protein